MKKCPKCGQSKPGSEYYKNAGRSDGLSSECKSCTLIRRHRDREASKPTPMSNEYFETLHSTDDAFHQFIDRTARRFGQPEDYSQVGWFGVSRGSSDESRESLMERGRREIETEHRRDWQRQDDEAYAMWLTSDDSGKTIIVTGETPYPWSKDASWSKNIDEKDEQRIKRFKKRNGD